MNYLPRTTAAAAFAGCMLMAHLQLSAAKPVSFTRDIRPLLSNNCFACHGPDKQNRKAGLRLDIAADAYSSEAITPGKLAESAAWQRINSTDPDEVMPPPNAHKELTAEDKDLFRRWIENGAKYEEHWSFVAPVKPSAPPTASHPVDALLQKRLQEAGLQPSPAADARTLIRRLTLDLTGLPPTPAEVEAFVNDKDTNAYEKLIDRLTSRSTYGEHMSRYWLDLARYADTHGLHLDNERSMWPYRDWVVRAFQQNLPFDDFTRWQLAGDLLPEPTQDQLIASGFNRCNVTTGEGGSIQAEWIYRYAVERTSTVAEVWMGLTAGCAVCHDHKFDPVSAREYYSLYAFFHSAADPAMDGNRRDTPPVLKIMSPSHKAKAKQLDEKLAAIDAALKQKLSTIKYNDPALADPKPQPQEVETIWFEDAFPAGSRPGATGAALSLVTKENGKVYSGQRAVFRKGTGITQDYYDKGAKPIEVPAGGKVFAYCYLDPDNPPETVMLQFHTKGWSHRAVWGAAAKIPWGKPGTAEKVEAGPLPATGKWVRLEIDAARMGLPAGAKISGFAFTQFGGAMYWDRLGVHTRIDTANDPTWSFSVWKQQNAGKRNNSLPEGLRQLVRGKQPEKWSKEEAARVSAFWMQNIYQGATGLLASSKAEKAAVEAEKKKLEENAPLTLIMADLPKPRESFVMLRGAYDKPGEKVTRGTPGFLPPLPPRPQGRDYNRLDLANWLVDGKHPLTARVAVNRLWQQFFGTGIVKTSGDFGSQGSLPTHPELLDWLAVTFVESGWDIRHMVKLIVTSHAYRQSSSITPAMLERDPANQLLARAPRLRLDAEVLRDQALSISGLLVQQTGGAPVRPYQPPGIWEPVAFGGSNTRYYKPGTGDALYRRSIYTFLKRTAPPPFMATFDAPNREQSCSRRERSNTPMQALQLMNDVQHVEAARNFAQRMLQEGGATSATRIAWAWTVVTSRPPSDTEVKIVQSALDKHLKRYREDAEAAKKLIAYGESKAATTLDPAELAAYTMVGNLLLNMDESVTKN